MGEEITLIFIVNGVDVPVLAFLNSLIETNRNIALTMSNNVGRPFEEWDVHNDAGMPLKPGDTVEEAGLEDRDRVFLNLKVGAGGA